MGTQKTIGESFVLAQESQEQVLGLYIRRAELAGLVPREEYDSSCLFRITLEHIARPPRSPEIERLNLRADAGLPTCVPTTKAPRPYIVIIVRLPLFYY